MRALATISRSSLRNPLQIIPTFLVDVGLDIAATGTAQLGWINGKRSLTDRRSHFHGYAGLSQVFDDANRFLRSLGCSCVHPGCHARRTSCSTMPELPEVETSRLYVEEFCLGSTVTRAIAMEQGGGPVRRTIFRKKTKQDVSLVPDS